MSLFCAVNEEKGTQRISRDNWKQEMDNKTKKAVQKMDYTTIPKYLHLLSIHRPISNTVKSRNVDCKDNLWNWNSVYSINCRRRKNFRYPLLNNIVKEITAEKC